MSSINSGISSPITVGPPNHAGGVLPKGKVNDPMPTIKDDGPHVGDPDGHGKKGVVPGKPGVEKPSDFVADSGVHGELNALFEGRPDGPGYIIPGSGLPPEKQFAKAKDRLLKELKSQQAEIGPAIANLKKIIAKSKNPAEVKEAKALIANYVAKEKCLAGMLSVVNNFKFPPGDGFSNNGQLTYVAGVFQGMDHDLRSSIGAASNANLLYLKKKLADLPPVDPRIAPPPFPPFEQTLAIPEGGQLPKPDPGPIAKTMAIPEGGQLPKPLELNPHGMSDPRLENGGCWDPNKPKNPPLGAGGPNPRKLP